MQRNDPGDQQRQLPTQTVEFGSATVNEALGRLRFQRSVLGAYARLQADPDAWADYRAEAWEWDRGHARDLQTLASTAAGEYSEYQ